jgi:SAM-dependent methyltransferase
MGERSSEWLVEDRPGSALWRMSVATYEWFNTHIESDDSVLDYGCGSGGGTSILAGSVTGVDIADEPLTYAASHYPNVDFRKVDSRLPFEDDTFDVICSSQVIEHVGPDQYLAEAARVLRPSGVLLVVTPPREHRLFPFQRPWNPYHLTEYSADQLVGVVGQWFGEVSYLPMRATGDLAKVERARWRKNRVLALPFTLPLMPDSWRRELILRLSEVVDRSRTFGNDPAGTVLFGEGHAAVVNHCVVARHPVS